MSTLNEEILRLKNAKAAIDEVLIARGVSIPENATLDTYNELINSIQGGTSSEEVTATKANVLAGTTTITADSNDEIVEGTMPNNGGQTVSLNCGESYTILEGYHDGTGIITANDLASQTVGTAIASDIINGQHAWVNGEEIVGSLQLTGNAGVAQVLEGTTFYNTNAKEIQTGTMVNRGAVAPSALGAGGSYTIPAGYHNGSGVVTVQSLATLTASGDATAAQILSGKKAYVDGSLLTGTMTDQGAKTSSLNCGGSYTIPAGYHNGSGKITANSLSSQTSANATAAQILKDKTAWVNGSKLTGTMAVTSAINFSATALSATSIRISWTNPSQGPWEGVFIQMSTSGNPGVSGGTRKYKGRGTNGTVGGASNYVDLTDFSPGTTYYFTCTSYVTGLGNGSSYNVSAKTSGFLIYNYGTAIGTIVDKTHYGELTINSNNIHVAKHKQDLSGYSLLRLIKGARFGFNVTGITTVNSLDNYSNIVIVSKPISYAYKATEVVNYALSFKWTFYDEDGYSDYTTWSLSASGNSLSLNAVGTIKIPISASENYKSNCSNYGYPVEIAISPNFHVYTDKTYAWGETEVYMIYLE